MIITTVSRFGGLVLFALLAGCANNSYLQMQKDITGVTTVATKVTQASTEAVRTAPIAVDSNKFWVSKSAIRVKDEGLSEAFNQTLQLSFEPKTSLREAIAVVARATKMRFSFAADVQNDSDKPLLLAGYRNQSTLKGFLDQITALPNPALSWQFKDGQVELFRYTTRVFPLNIPTTDHEFNSDISSKNQAGAGSVGSTSQTGHTVKIQSKLNYWNSIETEIKQMLTPGVGTVVVAKATGNVTVTDTPQVLNAVEAYIDNLNATALRRVYLNIQVVTIQNTASERYGINWDAVYGAMNSRFGFSFSSATTPSDFAPNAGLLSVVLRRPSGGFAPSAALLEVLSTLGKSAKIANYPQWTMSGIPTHTAVNKTQSYAASVSSTPATIAGVAATQSITPGSVTYGISLHSLPRVLDSTTIQLEESIQVSRLDRIGVFGQVESGQVQLPEQSSVSFVPVTTLKSGETLMMAGMEELDTSTTQRGVGSAEEAAVVAATGNRSGDVTKTTIVILITPYLM